MSWTSTGTILVIITVSLATRSQVQGTSCSETHNIIFDELVGRYGSRLDQLKLPTTTASGLTLVTPVIDGLSSILRSCNITMEIDNSTKNMYIELCISIKLVDLLTILKIDIGITTISSLTHVVVNDIDGQIRATVPLKKGGPIFVNKLSIRRVGEISIDNSGIVGSFDPFINIALKVKLKDVIIKMVNNIMAPEINKILANYPI